MILSQNHTLLESDCAKNNNDNNVNKIKHYNGDSKSTLWMPEIMENIGTYLTTSDLLSVACVNKTWHQCFAPQLWHSIDDTLNNWPLIIARISLTADITNVRQQQQHYDEKERIRKAFEKYGGYIRRLYLTQRELLSIISELRSCTQLHRMNVSLAHSRYSREQMKIESVRALNEDSKAREFERVYTIGKLPVLLPELTDVFMLQKESHLYTASQMEEDWASNQHFWAILLQNCETLQSLNMSESIMGSCKMINSKFIYTVLRRLRQLGELRNEMIFLRLDWLIDAVPKLKKYASWSHLIGNDWTSYYKDDASSSTWGENLRELEILGPIDNERLIGLLRRFPRLDQLILGRISSPSKVETIGTTDVTVAGLGPWKSQLKALQLKQPFNETSTVGSFLDILHLMPYLTRLSIKELDMKIAKAIGRECIHLETFSLWNEASPHSVPWSSARKFELNALNVILESCQQLKQVDANKCSIHVDCLLDDQPMWACKNLKLLRCQIIGHHCLTNDQLEVFQDINSPNATRHNISEYQQKIIKLGTERQAQYQATYARLSKLKHLVILDLGSTSYRSRSFCESLHDDLESELQFSRPPDAFEVSLSMGLDQLSTLESLEEFGFEGLGVNSIGNEELKWMVKNWPRLRVVKGLFDQRFDDAGTRQKKAKLRQELQILKPYVLFHREKTN